MNIILGNDIDTNNNPNVDQAIIKAVNYINEAGLSYIKAKPRSITSFLKGAITSPVYTTLFCVHKDICGIYPLIRLEKVEERLNALVRSDRINISNGCYYANNDIITNNVDHSKILKNEEADIAKYLNVSKTNEWIIKANFNFYDHESTFQKNGYIDWKQTIEPKVGDIVYVYITKPIQRIKIRAQVEMVNMNYSEITDDKEFWKEKSKYYGATKGKYMRLSLINKINKEELSYTNLLINGLPDMQTAFYKITDVKLLKYINDIFGITKEDLCIENPRNIPQKVKSYVWNRDQGKCAVCGSKENLQYDHIIPYSKGGTSLSSDNIRLLCQKCNLLKGNKI